MLKSSDNKQLNEYIHEWELSAYTASQELKKGLDKLVFEDTTSQSLISAMKNSFSELKAWMPWAQALASLRDTEVYLAHGERLWGSPPHDGIEQPLQILDPNGKLYYGATGIKPANLLIPSFETGYWVNVEYAKQGFITEAMNALTRYMLVALGAKRVEINCEERNEKSAKVAERLNFTFEAKLSNHRLDATQRHVTASLIYACTDVNQLPPLQCDWE